jgi:hypothetical protein
MPPTPPHTLKLFIILELRITIIVFVTSLKGKSKTRLCFYLYSLYARIIGTLIIWIDTFRMHIGMLRHNHISNTVSLEWEPSFSQSLVSSSQYHVKRPVPAGNSKRKLIITVNSDN